MLKRFYSYFGSYRKTFLLSCLFVGVETALELWIPLLMADIIDIGVATKDKNYIIIRSALMAGCGLLALLLGVLHARAAAVASQGFAANLREEQYKKIQSYSFSNLDYFSSSSLVSRLTSDVTILQNAISNGIRPLIRGPILMILGVVLSILLNRKLAVIFYVGLPILGIILYGILRKLAPLYKIMQQKLDKLNATIQENLVAIRVVKSFAQEDYAAEQFAIVNQENRDISLETLRYAVLNTPAFHAVMYASTIATLWFGGGFVRAGTLQVGQLTGFISYILQVLNSLTMISGVFLMLSRSAASASRMSQVLDEVSTITEPSSAVQSITSGEIEFKGVSFKYSDDAKEYVLSNIDLHILPGQTIGIIGGTGSAKSSLVQLIPRLYDITAGELLLDGTPVDQYSLGPLRDSVGMVLQKNTLFAGTIAENLRWGNPNATDEDLRQVCDVVVASEFVRQLPQGYDTMLEQGGRNLSGGQQQRLCIARALLKKPKMLILDDSTSAVDTATEASIREGLAQHFAKTTTLIIAQRISSVQDADQIVILEDGAVNQIGTHETLLAENNIYQDIYYAQKKGAEV